MQNKRSRVVWIIAIALAFFFIVDPFRLFESSNIPQIRVNSDLEAEMEQFVAEAPPAVDYVVGLLDEHELVMLGETGYVKNQLDLLAELIPALDRAGVRHLGFQYANVSDQQRVDDLVTGTSFDEKLAESILFDHMVILGYEEHKNVFRAAWQVNRSKSDSEEPFRIIALSTSPDYTRIVEQSDVEDPEILAQVFTNGIPDDVMYNTIMQELVEPGNRAVVYTQLEHAFTEFEQTGYSERMTESGFPGERRVGNRLGDTLGDRVVTVMFHTPLQDTRSRIGYGYPVGGVMDRLYESLPEGVTSVGFTVADSPYRDAPISSDVLTEDLEEDLTLENFTDGYLLISRIADYLPVTPIPDFITDENIERARAEFPGPDPGEVTTAEMNEFVAGTATSMARIFEEFE
jgi:hypothetical protein